MHILRDSGGRLSEEKSFSFHGSLLSARQHAGDLILVTNDWLDGSLPQIPCQQITHPVLEGAFDFRLTSVHTLNLAAEKLTTDSMATIGGVEQIYMSKKHLYLFQRGYSWFWWDPRFLGQPLYDSSIVTKLELRKGRAPELIAAAAVQGGTRNNLAFNEDPTGRYLFVATTIGWPGINRISVLGDVADPGPEASPFQLIARSEDFGHNEDIRAVRFIGERAYVVTFQKTDPLFVFDLSEPEKPRLLSELEIPGFSAYLHSLGPDTLFGTGYSAEPSGGFALVDGLQLSLFQLHEDGKVSVIEQKKLGGRGSHVDAAHDYHAFMRDARTGILALPVQLTAEEVSTGPWWSAPKIEFTGALMIDPASGLEPVGRLSHGDWLPEACREQLARPTWWSSARDALDVRRVIATDEGLVSLSPFGAKLHEPRPPFTTRAARAFANPETECAFTVAPHLRD